MAFDTQITDLVGGTIDQVACDQWAADACKEIIHVLPAKLKAKCSTVSTLNNSATTLDMDGIGDILHVTRLSADSGGYQVAAREIPAQYGGLAEDSSDLNYYGTASDPVYWVDSSSGVSTLKVKPTTTADQTAIVHHITYPTVNVSDVSIIANFPDEAEYLVVLYVATRQLHQYMNNIDISTFSQSASAPSAPVINAIAYTDATNADASATGVSTSTASVPATSTINVSGHAPSYTAPTIPSTAAGGTTTDDLTDMADSDWTSFDWDFDDENIDVATWFQAAGDMIQNQEDVELASAQIQKISTNIQAYGVAMQNRLNTFSKENARYQIEFQGAVNKANHDLQVAIANANSLAAEYRQEAQQTTNIDQFNKAQDQALNLSNASKTMEKLIQDNNSTLQKYSAEIQGYSSKVTVEIQVYQQEIAEKSTEYQWYGDQYTRLTAEYARGLTALIGGK